MAEHRPHVAVIGGGISGLAAAQALLHGAEAAHHSLDVTVFEGDTRLGGKIRTTPFAGMPALDEGADAFLARVPWAVGFAQAVGLGDQLISPAIGKAAVWWHGLQPIPEGLLLGMPTDIMKLARTPLLSWRGKLRAATEPLRPRTNVGTGPGADSIGAYVRSRFGAEVHERLVDPLVGSIYAADTDRFSLTAVPQLADLANQPGRSVLLAARHRPPAPTGPVFFAPNGGVGALIDAAAGEVQRHGGTITTGHTVEQLSRDGARWRVDGEAFDAVILACPAPAAARLLANDPAFATAHGALASVDTADVVLVSVAVPLASWPERLTGLSGYLVPKPVQRLVTATSFASQKWAHLHSPTSVLLRISLGRDGLPVMHLDDDAVLAAALGETSEHLGVTLQPTDVRISRWAGAFPQYRPLHHERVGAAEASLPATLTLAGASHHGIGIPACIRSAQRAAGATLTALFDTKE